jgi:serine/threonine-protein kinase
VLFPHEQEHTCPEGGRAATSPGPSLGANGTVNKPREAADEGGLVGLVLGERYAIEECLSSGGQGVVYRARHIVLDSPVAVKILRQAQDADAQRRFLVEAKVASLIRHPNTVYISDFGLLPDGRSYLVMEYLSGPTLAAVLRQSGGRLPAGRACQIAFQIAQGLEAVHAKGIVHRELSVR